MRRLIGALLIVIATALPAAGQFQEVEVLGRSTRASGRHTFPEMAVPTGVRGLRFTMDISQANGTLPAIAASLEGSLDGGATWMPVGAFTRASAAKGLNKQGVTQTTTGATFRGGPFWNDVDNTNRRLRGEATITGSLRFALAVQPL